MKKPLILGIYHPAQGIGHDSSVALIDGDGRILAAHSEERFSRIKMDGGFPFRSLEALKRMVPFAPRDLAAVAVPYWSGTEKAAEAGRLAIRMAADPHFGKAWLGARLAKDPYQREMEALGAYGYMNDYLAQIRAVSTSDRRPALGSCEDFLGYAGLGSVPLSRVDHHIAHVACAYFTSGWKDALIVTADGAGALKSGLVAVGREGNIQVLGRSFLPNSPGRFWEVITTLCGFNHHKHGGKTTGLAAAGNPDAACYEIMKKSLWADGLSVGSNLSPAALARELKGFSREDLAATAQRRLEEVMTEIVRNGVKAAGVRRVCLAGGVFGNVLLNQKIMELPEVEDIYVFPAMGDEGLAAGAALWTLSKKKTLLPTRFEDVYLGPEYSEKEAEDAMRRAGVHGKKLSQNEMVGKIADLLIAGKVIAYYEGRMEYGPRALGHRTILYKTQDPSVNQWLNERLHRSEFMPFAPVTLMEEAQKCYEGIRPDHYPSRFMTITYQCTAAMKKSSPAVVHKDGTARPQLIGPHEGRYYEVLKEYFRRTGVPSLVNTSFNMHEEPIVCTPDDAVRAYLQGGLDALVLGPYLIEGAKGP